MTALIQVLDYGSGNLFSIKDALARSSRGIKVSISQKYHEGVVDGLVLPGVGSFSSAQRILSKNKEAILQDVKVGMPVLGICLGMQLMFEKSEEGPGDGLKIFRGNVVRFKPETNLKVPHMGWNTIKLDSKSKFCSGLKAEEWVYYVHSFFPLPVDKEIVRAWTSYGRQAFPAVIERSKVFGTQFHPEKSSKAGFQLVRNFADSVTLYAK